MDGVLMIVNAGQAIQETNYFDSEMARRGFFYVTWNAGAIRLLIPDCAESVIEEMRTGRVCVVSSGVMRGGVMDGRRMLELMFDDGSESPFTMHLSADQVDRDVITSEVAVPVTAWSRKGLVGEWPGWYRVVEWLPSLEAAPDWIVRLADGSLVLSPGDRL
jgi:hypothetical protein